MIEHRIDQSGPFVHITMSGALGDDEAIRWFSELAGDLAELDTVSGLIDTRGLGPFDVTANGVRHLTQLVEQHEDLFADSRWAIVADTDVVFGMSRMYESLRAEARYELKVFREMDLAREWLGVVALLQSESLPVDRD